MQDRTEGKKSRQKNMWVEDSSVRLLQLRFVCIHLTNRARRRLGTKNGGSSLGRQPRCRKFEPLSGVRMRMQSAKHCPLPGADVGQGNPNGEC